jgi:hypothetical protein
MGNGLTPSGLNPYTIFIDRGGVTQGPVVSAVCAAHGRAELELTRHEPTS